MNGAADREIAAAVRRVYDPCSLGSNIPMNVLDMGLVRSWTVSDGHVEVTMIVTSPVCWQTGVMAGAIEEELLALPGVTSAKVIIDPEVLWSPDMMAAETMSQVAQLRAQSKQITGVRPQQWREKV